MYVHLRGAQLQYKRLPLFLADWHNVSLSDFMNCSSNPANNRQTRMLANLTKLDCGYVEYWMNTAPGENGTSTDVLHHPLLNNAMRNLQAMAFFGLTEYPAESSRLFEKTFDISFKTHQNLAYTRAVAIDSTIQRKAAELNKLDVELYEFAKLLFFQRLKYFNITPLSYI